MLISDFTNEEVSFLVNLLLNPDATNPEFQPDMCRPLGNLLAFSSAPFDLDRQQVGFLQSLLQVQSEIWGRQNSTANEKLPVTLASFVPQKTRQLIKSISDKLGAHIYVDVTTPSFPVTPRDEGSISIMKDPTIK